MSSSAVSIVFCAVCGYEPLARALAEDIDSSLGDVLPPTKLVPWGDGSFDVVYRGTTLHSMMIQGGIPTSSTMIEMIKAHLSSDQ